MLRMMGMIDPNQIKKDKHGIIKAGTVFSDIREEEVESMESDNYQCVMEKCKEFEKGLGDQPNLFNSSVVVSLDDGTYLHLMNSFVKKTMDKDGKGWLCVFPEHYPTMIFPAEDLCYHQVFNENKDESFWLIEGENADGRYK